MTVGYRNQPYPNMLKVTRQNAGYQQNYISKRLGHRCNRLLSLWENEKVMPGGTNLIKLCILYNSTPQTLYPDYFDHVEQNLTKPLPNSLTGL